MKRTLNRLLSLILTAALLVSAAPTQAFAAEETEVYLPEIEIGNDILDYDVFYLATAAASVEESGNHAYLLRIGRGGPADSESSVLVKIADMTAKYGEDYVVRVRDERTKVDNPEDNFSLMEMIEDSDFEQKPISDSDEFAEMIQDDPDAQAAYREGVETAMEFLEEASGLSDKYDGEDPYAGALEALYGTQADPVEDEDTGHLLDGDAEPAESDAGEYAEGAGSLEAEIEAVPDWENGAIPANGDGETLTIGGSAEADTDPLRRAVNFFTGRDASPQRLTAEGDMLQDLQAIANVMTNVVVGASVELAFAPGETEKYLEIVPKDNRTGDGDRMFYVILGAPGGKTTNSAASTCAFTIVDDEEAEPAVVSFSDTVYSASGESVTVTVERSGAMNTVISAKVVTTGEGTARAGRDYSEVDAELVFPFGVNHLTLDIPVRTDYLTGEGSFGLALEPTAGCVTGENGTAAVYLDGSYTDKASLYAAQSGRTPNEPGTATLMAESSAPVDKNNLSTYKTLNAINIRNPLKTETSGSGYKGINAYNSSGFYQTMWKGSVKDGTVATVYELTDDYWTSYFLAGAEVDWWRSYGCGTRAYMKIAIAGKTAYSNGSLKYYPFSTWADRSNNNWKGKDNNPVFWYPYDSNQDFDRQTRYVYPHINAVDPDKQGGYVDDGSWRPMLAGDHPQAIEFLNIGMCKDCSQLWLWGLKPILRPFQVNIKTAEPLTYLKADGTRSEVTNATTTNATIVEAGSQSVLFRDDSFTVSTTAGPDVRQYGYLSALKLMDGADENKTLYTLATNDDPSNTSIQYTLNTDNMQKLISSICPDYARGFTQNWYNLLRENTYARENRSNVDGYPTFVLFNVKPEFSYINASVTLRNPYDFPVTMTISGTDYTLAARETRKIKAPDGQEFHLGDTLAVTKITLNATDGVLYTPVGIKYSAVNIQTGDPVDGTMNFYDGKPVNFAGFDGDGRLNTKEIIVEPNLQVSNNKIQVRVKTSELSRFDTAIEYDENGKLTHHAGVLAQEGTVIGEYTYFTFADEKNTVNGKLYAITATPLADDYVAEWYDGTTMRTYVGNTLYFTAMDTPERNVITLSIAPVAGTVTLKGTLYYTNYNLRTGYSGNASNVPAVGAALSAGSAGGMANKNGYVTAGPIPVSDREDRYLRYMVSINGTDVVKEMAQPTLAAAIYAPTMLWDFNSDEAMNSNIVGSNGMEYHGETDEDENDYYTFTINGQNAGVTLSNTSRVSNEDIQWIKLRAKVVSGTGKTCFYGYVDGWNALQAILGAAYSNAPYDLTADGQWHEYVFNIRQANLAFLQSSSGSYTESFWQGAFASITFNPSIDSGNGVIQVDYMAFFPDEDSAKAFRNDDAVVDGFLDISANFPSGVSPVNSAIFDDVQITGKMSDSAYQVQDNTYIPVVPGKSADMTIKIKPAEYSYTMTGEKGAVIQGSKTEYPVSVQLVVYDSNDVFKDVYDAVDSFSMKSGYMTATSHMDFVEPSEGVMKTDENGKLVFDEKGEPVWVEEPVTGILPEPGDKLYLRLVTDRLLQAEELADGEEISGDYRYSDIFTGMYFYQPAAYERPPEMGIRTPIEIEYGNLPLIGSTGMDLAFPFVSVGIMKIQHGYRIYIGVSPVQIMDTVKGTHVSAFSGAGGEYWKSLFSIKSPFQSFSEGLSKASETIGMVRDAAKATAASNKANGTNESVGDAGLGSHSWRFDISLGMYFDFINPTVTQDGISHTSYVFNGMGGYVSVTLGFTMAWYIVLPVVFLPAYLGIEMQGTVMGYLGATLNKDVEITYADALNGSASINDGITELTGGIRGYGYVQISAGIGLCGTLGVRGAGKVNLIANWEPDDPNGSWGAYIGLQAGLIIDLFLFSIPLMYSFAGWPFGSFEYYSNPEKHTLQSTSLMGAQDRVLMLRESSGEDSMWLGDQMLLQGAFRPNKQKEAILAVDPYERPDSQLITLSDGKTLALAFIDSDSSKAVTQRTTLKLSIYDADTGLWSAPVPVSADKTADFQPSIAETKDGRLLVAWVSTSDDTITDISTDEQAMKYLDSMDVYAAFVEFDEDNQIKTKDDPVYGISADTEVTRISNDRIGDYYDANPTVVCDMESGDAIVYYIKSERVYVDGDEVGEYINPYTNDSVVSYIIYSAQGVEVTKTKPGEFGAEPETETIIEHWLFDYYYPGERDHNTAGLTDEEAEMAYAMLISFFGGQRFLDGPVNNENERYAIPDFTAIGYDGLSVCAYTIDPDGSSNTDADKELYLQVYDFQNHRTKYQTILTNDSVSDTLPQLFRSRVNTDSGAEAHTKLFWYRDGKQVVYIDVTELLRDGINADGTLKTSDETGTECSYTEPIPVYFYADDSHASLQSADFKAVEDDRGNLYILWTASVTDENGNAAREIFGTGLVEYTVTDQDGDTSAATSGWSKPYRITDDGYHNDELAVAMSGENLITVHNRYREELVSVPEGTEYNGQVGFMPIRFSDMALVAETMEPCGSMEAESIRLYSADGSPVTLPNGGDTLTIEVEVSNNGMNTAQGYKLSLYADDTPVGEIESTDALVPNNHRTHTFQYTLPADVEGLTFKAVVQEMRDAQTMQYYRDTDTYVNDPLEARASYEISDVETYQGVDGFHSAFTVTNTGNAASSAEDTLNVKLRGPANLGDLYTDALYSSGISLSVGESKDFDVPVAILPEMMEDFGFVTALITVQKEVVEQTVGDTELKGLRYLSNLVYADFDLVQPMNMELQDVTVAANKTASITFSMDLGDVLRGHDDTVTYAVDDLNIAQISGSKVLGVAEGTTKLYATHASTGATTESTITVTPATDESDEPVTPYVPDDSSDDGTISVEVSGDEGSVSVSAAVSGNTATITAPTDAQIAEITDRAGEIGAVTIDLSSLPENITAVSIPARTVKAIDEAMEEDGKGLTIKLPNSTVTFDAAALAPIAEQTTGGDLQLNVEPITETKLTSAQKGAVAELDVQAVYDIYLTSGGKRITDLGGGKAAVEIKHKVKDGQQPGGFVVWYAADDGTKEKVPTTATKDAVKFTVTHFSNYVVAYDETLPGACDKGGDCPMSAFDDLDKTSWYHDGVHWALENEIMNGYGVGKFGPNDATSRAMIVTMLYRMEGSPMIRSGIIFDDVTEKDWYGMAVSWAESKGIVNGYGDGRFGPNDPVAREQFATILYRYAKMKGKGFTGMWAFPLSFDDASDVSDWAYEAMCWMTMNGIIQGTGNNKLSPKGSATRAQVATMLMRFEAIEQ